MTCLWYLTLVCALCLVKVMTFPFSSSTILSVRVLLLSWFPATHTFSRDFVSNLLPFRWNLVTWPFFGFCDLHTFRDLVIVSNLHPSLRNLVTWPFFGFCDFHPFRDLVIVSNLHQSRQNLATWPFFRFYDLPILGILSSSVTYTRQDGILLLGQFLAFVTAPF